MRIALLTPYTGTNLGDGAIHAAAIQYLRKLVPGVELLGLTLRPSETSRRHGIPAFPITGLFVEWYSNALFLPKDFDATAKAPANAATAAAEPAGPPSWRTRLKTLPLVGTALRFVVFRLRDAGRILAELRHLVESWRVAKKLDLIIVAGGGQLDDEYGGPWGHPYAIFRWAMLARLTGTRFAVASIGAQTMKHPLSRWFVKRALATCAYRSYREIHSKRQLEMWDFVRHDPLVPDLAFGMDLGTIAHPPFPPAGAALVGFSPIAFGDPDHWPTDERAVFENYLNCLVDFAQWLLDRGHRLLLFRTSSSDRAAMAALRTRLIERNGPEVVDRLAEPTVTTIEEFFTELRAADLVVASRLHGVILSHLLHKPVLPISFERKVDAHVEDMDQMQYRLDIRTVTLADLKDRFLALEGAAEPERRAIAARVDERRTQQEAQYRELLRLAGHPVP